MSQQPGSEEPNTPEFGELATPARPARPEYGEYATPEEQRARIAQPADATAWAAPVEKSGNLFASAPAAKNASAGSGAKAATAVARNLLVDRILTSLLLGYGFISVITTLPSLFDLPLLMNQAYDELAAQGVIPEAPVFEGSQLASTLGWILAIVWASLWVVSFAWALQRMRTGKLAFWVPLAAGIVASLLLAGTAMFLVASDPAFIDILNQVANDTAIETAAN